MRQLCFRDGSVITSEHGCFRWLEKCAARDYETVIDIGANVGI
jgi:hypothetical protein